jgi:NAD(P)-dependent dehydrogenase (short-subunit alcohol dehydrogenase family)
MVHPIANHGATDGRVVLITGASSGFGALIACALAASGHTVYAGMRQLDGRNAAAATALTDYATSNDFTIQPVDLDVTDQQTIDRAVATLLETTQQLDVVVHNAGHMVLGPAEAFSPEELAEQYDVNVLGTQRVNRTVLPQLRAQGSGHLVWISSNSVHGGTPPFVGPYFAAKSAMDNLAVTYAGELIRFGIETTIVVPGAYLSGTNHFAHSGRPADTARAAEYDDLYGEFQRQMAERLGALIPDDATPDAVADAVVTAVNAPPGRRPYRVHVDPSRNGGEIVSTVADRIRAEFLYRAGLEDLLTPTSSL